VGRSGAAPTHIDHINGLILPNGRDAFPQLSWLLVPKALQFDKPEIAWEFDADQDQARASRLRIMALAADDNDHVAGAHLDSPGVGRASRVGNSFRFDPL
jgi:hypothetical protein